jgi:hypothetical protein
MRPSRRGSRKGDPLQVENAIRSLVRSAPPAVEAAASTASRWVERTTVYRTADEPPSRTPLAVELDVDPFRAQLRQRRVALLGSAASALAEQALPS